MGRPNAIFNKYTSLDLMNIIGPNFNHKPIQQVLPTTYGPKIHINKQIKPKSHNVKPKTKIKLKKKRNERNKIK